MLFWTILLTALATISASDTKRTREEDSSKSGPNKKLKTEIAPFDTATIPTEIWQLISDKVEYGSLPSLAGVNYTLEAVSKRSAALILGNDGSFTTGQFITLLPLVLHHLAVAKLPANQVIDRFVALLATATTKDQVYRIMMCWRACYGTSSDHILFDGLVHFMWKNETVLKQEMTTNENSFYSESRYQFFYPMALLASNFHKARLIWITFAAHIIQNSTSDESGSEFVRDIFETLDENVQMMTMENIVAAHVLGKEKSTHDEDGNPSYLIGALETAIGRTLPEMTMDELNYMLDKITQDDFDDLLAALQFAHKLFYADSIFKSHPTVLEYRRRTEALGQQLCLQPLGSVQKFAGVSVVQWRLLATLLSTESHEQIGDCLWLSESFEEMAVYWFALPGYKRMVMDITLPRFLNAHQGKHSVQVLSAAHWYVLKYFYRDYLHELVWERLEADIVELVSNHLEDSELISCYNEALNISEFKSFLQSRLEICRIRLIRDFGGDLSSLDAIKKLLVQILPDHADIFQ